MKSNKLKLKSWVKKSLITLGIGVIVFILIGLTVYLNNDLNRHIEKVSAECAKSGYGIKIKYTNTGDKYYVCNK